MQALDTLTSLLRRRARWRARTRSEERSELAGIIAETEAAFDTADALAERDDLEHALRSLATGERLCGGLTPGYLAKRIRWRADLTRQRLS